MNNAASGLRQGRVVVIYGALTCSYNLLIRARLNKMYYYDEHGRTRSAEAATSWYVRSGDFVVFRGWANPKRTEEGGIVFLDFTGAEVMRETYLDPAVCEPSEVE